jgi:energy-coupling factor transporter ATP-binding protein EcfA2
MTAQPNTGTDIALLIGPTGAGKTTLASALRDRLIVEYQTEMQEDHSFMPIVLVEAPASGEQSFSWRMFYTRLGIQLAEPLMDRKVRTLLDDGRMTVAPLTNGSTVASLRGAVENALKHRKTLLVVVDEAVHLIRNCKDARLSGHMDALKSLSNISGVTLALVGSYDLYKLMNLTGQLTRRSTIVHLQRYIPGEAEDEISFRKVLRTLQKRLPLEEIPELENFALPLQHACVGCVGILKDTLSRALALTLRNEGHWKEEFLERALLSEAQVSSILSEVLEGEHSISGALFSVNKRRLT